MMHPISEKIRVIRNEKKLTLKALSEASGLSVSKLSKLENGKVRLSVDTAMALANLLNVPVVALLAKPSGRALSRRSITRAGTGVRHRQPGMEFEVLCGDLKEKQNVFWQVVVTASTPDEGGGWRQHPGEEFLYILSGVLELHTEHYEPIELAAGDSIVFDADMRHAYVALNGEAVRLIMSNSVPVNAAVETPKKVLMAGRPRRSRETSTSSESKRDPSPVPGASCP
jgi:transcriptional regulator with XRE-family HTH domain